MEITEFKTMEGVQRKTLKNSVRKDIEGTQINWGYSCGNNICKLFKFGPFQIFLCDAFKASSVLNFTFLAIHFLLTPGMVPEIILTEKLHTHTKRLAKYKIFR